MSRCFLATGTGLTLLFALATASAQPTAETLFQEGKADVAAKNYEAACPKFEESYRMSNVPGALLSWADCEEQRQRLVKAMSLWEQSEVAVAEDAERLAFVRRRIASLQPRIPKLKIVAGVLDATVTVDENPVDHTEGPIRVDPGTHRIVATAPGRPEESAEVQVAEGQTKTQTFFGGVAEKDEPTPPKPVAHPDSDDGGTLRLAGWIVGSFGVAGALAFAGTGIAVVVECEDNICPDGWNGVLIGNAVSAGVGGAALITGVVLLAVGYSRRPDETPVAVSAGPGDVGLGLHFAF